MNANTSKPVTQSVAIYAPRPQQGKTTVAQMLIAAGYRLVQFSAPLREPLYAAGLDARHVEGEFKEKPFPKKALTSLIDQGVFPSGFILSEMAKEGKWEAGKPVLTPRDFMKARALQLGDEELIERARDKILAAHKNGAPVVLDDLRWVSQYDFLASLGDAFQLWRVEMPLPDGQQAQVQDSRFEGLLEDRHFDFYLQNDGTLEELEAKVSARLAE